MLRTKTVYRVTSPLNFSPDKNMKQGTFKDFDEIPEWAINNTRLVIEKIEVKEEIVLPKLIDDTLVNETTKEVKKTKGRKSTNKKIKKNESKGKISKSDDKKRRVKKAR